MLQGMELNEWEHQQQQAQLTASLQQKEEQLKSLREGLRVTVEDVNVPEEEQLHKEVRFRKPVKAIENIFHALMSISSDTLCMVLCSWCVQR